MTGLIDAELVPGPTVVDEEALIGDIRPNAPTNMVAEKGADLVLDEL